jgi:hypothetical protein
VTRESYVAGVLGLSGYGDNRPFQRVESAQSIPPLANRCRARKARTSLKDLVDPEFTHAQIRAFPGDGAMARPERRAAAKAIMKQLMELRARCQRQTSSLVTPMGDEMFYRYQQSLIDDATTTLSTLLHSSEAPLRNSPYPAE